MLANWTQDTTFVQDSLAKKTVPRLQTRHRKMEKSIKICEKCGGPTGDNIVLCVPCVERICVGPPTGSGPPMTSKSKSSGAYDPYPTDSGSGSSHEPDSDPTTPPETAANQGGKACTICNTLLEYDTYDYCTSCAQLLKDTAVSDWEPQTTGESSASGARRTATSSDSSYVPTWAPQTTGGGSSSGGYNPHQTGSGSGSSGAPAWPPRVTDSRNTGNAYKTDAELMPPPPRPVPRGTSSSRPDGASSFGSRALLTTEDDALIARGHTPGHRADIETVIRNLKEMGENNRRSEVRRKAREAEDED